MVEFVPLALKLLPLAILAFFAGLVLFAFLVEKNYIHQFEPASTDQIRNSSPYFVAMNQMAQDLGFIHCGIFAQAGRGKAYKVLLAIWLSPSGAIMAMIGGGQVAGIPYKITRLRTEVEEGALFETSDCILAPDLSGLMKQKSLLKAGLHELHDLHLKWLEEGNVAARPFSQNCVIRDLETMDFNKAQKLEQMGLAHFLDPSRNIWKYTLKGAILAWFGGQVRQFKELSKQSSRGAIKRPGG